MFWLKNKMIHSISLISVRSSKSCIRICFLPTVKIVKVQVGLNSTQPMAIIMAK